MFTAVYSTDYFDQLSNFRIRYDHGRIRVADPDFEIWSDPVFKIGDGSGSDQNINIYNPSKIESNFSTNISIILTFMSKGK